MEERHRKSLENASLLEKERREGGEKQGEGVSWSLRRKKSDETEPVSAPASFLRCFFQDGGCYVEMEMDQRSRMQKMKRPVEAARAFVSFARRRGSRRVASQHRPSKRRASLTHRESSLFFLNL